MSSVPCKNKVEKVKGWKWWRNKLDKAMSELVREKRICEWCGSTTNQMNWSHVVGRGNKTLRWDILNALCLCSYCHRFKWHENPLDAMEWFKTKFPERYEYLLWAKNEFVDRTEADLANLLDAINLRKFDKLILDKSHC